MRSSMLRHSFGLWANAVEPGPKITAGDLVLSTTGPASQYQGAPIMEDS